MTSSASTAPPARSTSVVQAATANEWGQVSGLEPHATYFVVRKPTADFTRERSKEVMHEVRAFLHEQRLLTEKQMQDLNERYGQPAKAKAKEIRETLEKRFDEIAKEVEARFEKLESDLGERAPGVFRRKNDAAPETPTGSTIETPGEMPTGESMGSSTAGPKPRKGPKKAE